MAKTSKPASVPSPDSVSVLQSLRALVEPDEILEAGRRLGMIQRDRKLDLAALVESTILAVWPTPGMRIRSAITVDCGLDLSRASGPFRPLRAWALRLAAEGRE